MKIAILDKATLGEALEYDLVDALGQVERYENTSKDQLIDRLQGVTVAISNKCVYSKEVIEAAKDLKLICSTGTGYNTVDLETARNRGVGVTNVKDYCTDSVAQHTIAMVLHLRHQLGYYRDYTSSGEYVEDHKYKHYSRPFHELPGATWGIIGMGNIGKKVASLAQILGCHIQYHSTSGKNLSQAYKHVTLDELLASSDIITIHAPLNDQTHHLIGKDNVHLLSPKTILVNVGRGAIIDAEALVEHVKERGIGGLGLDVLEVEPMEASSPIKEIMDQDRVLLTPHVAWASVEARQRVICEVAYNIKSFLEGGKRNRVD